MISHIHPVLKENYLALTFSPSPANNSFGKLYKNIFVYLNGDNVKEPNTKFSLNIRIL
jgi:hypothetical protein